MAQVAVAVVSWNTRDLLGRCLESMRADAESGLAEVWCVDNASSDGSARMVADSFGWVRLIEARENLGFGPAVNLVAERTATPWVAPANADLELFPGALGRLVDAGSEDPLSGILAPRLMLPDGSTQHSVHAFPRPALAVAHGAGMHRLVPGLGDRLCIDGLWDPNRPRHVDWAHGALLVVRREAWERVGGFDPLQWMYAEDIDLAWRIREEGWLTRYVPDARVKHHVSAAAEQAFGHERARRHMAAAYGWMARRQGVGTTWVTAAANVAGALARLALLTPLSWVLPDRFGPARRTARRFVSLHRLGLRRGSELRTAR